MRRFTLLALGILLTCIGAAFLVSCEGGSSGNAALAEFLCGNGLDDDGDGLADCADVDCECIGVCPGHVENCADGRDNDCDGLVDCADPNCAGVNPCPNNGEICNNGIDDNDADLLADCADPDCVNAPNCVQVEDCDNTVDDDGDNDIDCNDADCALDPNCQPGPPENCTQGGDEDGDGDVNCADDDCVNDPVCQNVPPENCTNGVDDDFDHAIDCSDADCVGTAACPTPHENCCDPNGVDEDGDGLSNFNDPDCPNTNTDNDQIPNICDNCPTKTNPPQVDNDQDGHGNPCDNCTDDFNPDQADNDNDGSGNVCDCAPNNAAIHPGATEKCNNLDDNCDGNIDEGCDDDGDNYCDANLTFTVSSTCPNGDTDCDDNDAAIHPGAQETCGNGVDEDCDGLIDQNDPSHINITYHRDADCDGYGSNAPGHATQQACTQPPQDGGGCWSTSADDCNDVNPNINPGETESCNAIDDNCDGSIDEEGSAGCTVYYDDVDGDGYGDSNDPGHCLCVQPNNTVTNNDDCDDSDPNVHPNVCDDCNGVDDDCDGSIDEDAGNCGNPTPTWYHDADGDTFGDQNDGGVTQCSPPAYPASQDNTDCNDNNSAVHPGAAEVCDGIADNNCDGNDDPDEIDNDGDNFTECDGDCDDGDNTVYPGATELCDGIDNNCTGGIDENFPTKGDACDGGDADSCANGTLTCSVDGLSLVCTGDTSNNTNIESNGNNCGDGIDNDCDGFIDCADTGDCPACTGCGGGGKCRGGVCGAGGQCP